jgi:hypothetical protein
MPEHPTLAAALVAAQTEMPAVAKDGTNPHFRSQFVTLDALIAATRPILNRHGLSIAQGATGDHNEPRLTTTLQHTSGEAWGLTMPLYVSSTPIEKGSAVREQTMQTFGAAITYARRYAWAAILGIASEEDDDHAGASGASTIRDGKGGFNPPPPRENGGGPITDPQHKKIAVLIHNLDETRIKHPDGYDGAEDWIGVLKMALQARYKIESRKDLTRDQASDLIDWLSMQEIPF